MLRLINDILDFSKIEAGRLDLETVNFDLLALLDDFSPGVAIQAREKGLQIHFEIDPLVPAAVRGDPGRLRQILTNLVGNAIKFTPAGSVVLKVQPSATSADPFHLSFFIRDTGIGIPADKISLLFEKFTQVDASTTRQFGGTGLGLAISRQLARMMGGDAGASSQLGQGSEFWFSVRLDKPFRPSVEPVLPDIVAKRPETNRLVNIFSKRQARVLLAEDNIINQQVALGILKKFGLSADAVANGEEALAALATISYDLVLMDVQMPVMDGLEAVRKIRNPDSAVLNHQVTVIAMTAEAMHGDRKKCLDAGMSDYLAKPVMPQALADVLASWLPPEEITHERDS